MRTNKYEVQRTKDETRKAATVCSSFVLRPSSFARSSFARSSFARSSFARSSFVLRPSSFACRPAFTLTELLMVMAIIALLAGLGLSALSGAVELGREQRTRAEIDKIDQLIMERYEGYRTRAVPLRLAANLPVPAGVAESVYRSRLRLTALRELMRLEMPDRISDLCNDTELTDLGNDNTLNAINNVGAAKTSGLLTAMPSLARAYKRKAAVAINNKGGWTAANQGSECLYLILSTMGDGDKSALDFFTADEIGDTDEDGMNEILDGWGRPIEFLRWPAGYAEQPGPDGAWGVAGVDDDGNGTTDDLVEAGWRGSDDVAPRTMQTRNWLVAPDPFDPAKSDPRWTSGGAFRPYALHPLIYSSGPDKVFDINVGNVVYSTTTPFSDPYYSSTTGGLPDIGLVIDTNGDGTDSGFADNVTNHDLTSQ